MMGPRLMAALAALPLLSSAAQAGVAEELTAAINTCAAITEDVTRHACYDRLPALVKALGPVAESTAASKPAAPPEDKDSFSSLFDGEPLPADRITATVASVAYYSGAFTVALDNGQVWTQIAATGDPVRFSREKKDQVTIWRSRFGYDVLKIEGRHVTYHVKRIK